MELAARQYTWPDGAKGWVNPYVTDGLIAMWDGEWNAGGGVHDDLATGLKDLVGNHDLTLVGTCDWSNGYAALDSNSYFKNESAKIDSGVGQIELAGQFNKSEASLIGLSNNYAMGSYSGWVLCLARVGINRYVSNDYAPFTLSVEYDVDCNPQKAYWRNVNRISYGGERAKNLGDFISISGMTQSQPRNFYSLRVYSKVLTDAERNANYAIDKERFSLT